MNILQTAPRSKTISITVWDHLIDLGVGSEEGPTVFVDRSFTSRSSSVPDT
jgi:hypothetical protein